MQPHSLGAVKSRGSFISVFAFLMVSALALPALPAGAASVPEPAGKPGTPGTAVGNLDVRVHGVRQVPGLLAARPAPAVSAARAAARREGLARLQAASPGAEVRLSPLSGGAELVRSRRGALTEAAPGRPGVDIVRGFLRDHRGLFGLSEADLTGLRFKGESVSRRSGLRLVRFEQTVGGVPVFGSDTRVTLDREGRVLRLVGLVLPDAGASAPASAGPALAPRVTPEQALVTAMKSVGIELAAAGVRSESPSPDKTLGATPGSNGRVVLAGDPRIRGKVASQLVYFPLAPGVLVPAWQQFAFTSGRAATGPTLVDAAPTGTAALAQEHARATSRPRRPASASTCRRDGTTPADSPAPQSPTDRRAGLRHAVPEIPRTDRHHVDGAGPRRQPNGWIPDGGTTTTGNNVDACLDRVRDAGNNVCDTGTLDNNGRPVGNPDANGRNRDFLGTAPRDFNYIPAAAGRQPERRRRPDRHGQPRTPSAAAPSRSCSTSPTGTTTGSSSSASTRPPATSRTPTSAAWALGGDRVLADAQDGIGHQQRQLRHAAGRHARPDADVPLHRPDPGPRRRPRRRDRHPRADPRPLQPPDRQRPPASSGTRAAAWARAGATSTRSPCSTTPTPTIPDGSTPSAPTPRYKLGGLTDNYVYGIRRFPYSHRQHGQPADLGGRRRRHGRHRRRHRPDQPARLRDQRRLRGPQHRRDLGPDAVGGPQPHHRRSRRAPTATCRRRQPDHAAARHRRHEDDADQPQLHSTPATRCIGRLRHQRLRQRALDLGGLRRPRPGLRRRRAARPGIGVTAYLGPHGHRRVVRRRPISTSTAATVDDSLGNDNGAIDPGEPVRLAVRLQQPVARRGPHRLARRRGHPHHLDARRDDPQRHVTYPADRGPGQRGRHALRRSSWIRAPPAASRSTSRSPSPPRSAPPAATSRCASAPAPAPAPRDLQPGPPGGLAIPDNEPARRLRTCSPSPTTSRSPTSTSASTTWPTPSPAT